MEDTFVTKIGNLNFKILSCMEVADLKSGKGSLNEANIQELMEPLIEKGYKGDFIKKVESKIKSFVSSLFDLPDEVKKMDFKDDNNQEYSILCHKVSPVIFGFLLQPIDAEKLREIEKNAKGKTYLTGDMTDMFKTKKDLN